TRDGHMLPRRIRGLLGIMTTWGIAFSVIGVASLSAVVLSGAVSDSIIGFRHLPLVALRGFLAGALSGGLFSALLVWRERSKGVSTVSVRRMATWGFLGAGSLVPVMALAAGTIGIIRAPILITASLV